jgi:hypothetical protein
MNRVVPFQPSDQQFTTLIPQAFCTAAAPRRRAALGRPRCVRPSAAVRPVFENTLQSSPQWPAGLNIQQLAKIVSK